MDQDTAITAFAALAQPTRLSVFRLLIQTTPNALPASEIGRRLDVVPSTLSGHLATLRRAGCVTSTRHQKEIHYAANLTCVRDLVRFLLADCCGGQIDNCGEILNALDCALAP